MDMSIPIIAGTTSTIIFAGSTLPMLFKARKTKDLGSYSLGNILLSNLGNLIHSIYVFSLPMGPIWLLHSFYLVTTGLMLLWYWRFEGRQQVGGRVADSEDGDSRLAVPINSDWLTKVRDRQAANRKPALVMLAYGDSRLARSLGRRSRNSRKGRASSPSSLVPGEHKLQPAS